MKTRDYLFLYSIHKVRISLDENDLYLLHSLQYHLWIPLKIFSMRRSGVVPKINPISVSYENICIIEWMEKASQKSAFFIWFPLIPDFNTYQQVIKYIDSIPEVYCNKFLLEAFT